MARVKKPEVISLLELAKSSHTFPTAWDALLKYNAIQRKNGMPVILRQGNSFWVRDELDPRQYRREFGGHKSL